MENLVATPSNENIHTPIFGANVDTDGFTMVTKRKRNTNWTRQRSSNMMEMLHTQNRFASLVSDDDNENQGSIVTGYHLREQIVEYTQRVNHEATMENVAKTNPVSQWWNQWSGMLEDCATPLLKNKLCRCCKKWVHDLCSLGNKNAYFLYIRSSEGYKRKLAMVLEFLLV